MFIVCCNEMLAPNVPVTTQVVAFDDRDRAIDFAATIVVTRLRREPPPQERGDALMNLASPSLEIVANYIKYHNSFRVYRPDSVSWGVEVKEPDANLSRYGG